MGRASEGQQGGREVRIDSGGAALEGTLCVPASAVGVVAFVHGSGSSRFSPRNRAVARWLNERCLGTLLFDLLTSEEEAFDDRSGALRFDVDFLWQRTVTALDALARFPESAGMPIGLFGSSTGAAAALIAAARRPEVIAAVVSRGGRVDLAADWLGRVRAPTQFIVGGRDREVLELNRRAYRALGASMRSLEIVPGATHLFEEPGTLERVGALAGEWFSRAFAQVQGLPAQP